MTIDVIAPTVRNPIAGIGPYALGWPYYADTVTAAVEIDGVVTALDPIHFSVTPTASTSAGNLYLTPDAATLHAGQILVISRRTPPEQGWQATQGERETGLEVQLDRIVMLQQEQAGQLAGTLRVSGADVAPLIPEAGRSIFWDGTKFVPGPMADEIANAQSYAERAELAAGALTSLTDRVPYSFLITASNSGRGPYALPYDPGAVDLIDLYINGLMQSSADHFEIVVMPAAASGKGVQFLDDQTTGHRVDLKFALPLGYDPAVNTAMDFATLADFQAAVTAGLTRMNGRYLTAAGTGYVAKTGTVIAGIPAGWTPARHVWTEAELIATTDPVSPGQDIVEVNVGGEIVFYRREPGAVGPDSIEAGDGSDWAKASLTSADLLAAVSDVISGLTAIIPAEGAFTPSLTFATPGTMSVAYGATLLGYYYKLGSRVYCEVNINTAMITKGSASGRFRLAFSDLPYTPNAGSVSTGTVRFKPSQITIPATAIELVPTIVPGQKYIEFAWYSLTSGSANYLAVADVAETAMILQVVFEFRV